ncbi:MAG: molybdenum ABC transporter ATP-binding protein [Alphaproteobacteria bacterium]|nr:molybdenum ABC transporter ATP-binding protein [Alphaproteobacteria bacterium]
MTAGTISVAFAGKIGEFALNAAFSVPARGVTGLFGPSGCGKTALLRCIAGLQRLTRGHCVIDGDVWQEGQEFRPVHQRPVGYVFQEASLFPHLSVIGNLLYATRGRKPAAPSEAITFDDVVSLLGLESLLERAPRHLSGGERQRVAVGRALLSQPKLLLMDEPLSALDASTKDDILPFLERIHESLSLPVIYVSHDLAEVERLADYLVLMRAGEALAAGPLSSVQSDPRLPLAATRDAAVTLDAVVRAYDGDYGLARLAVDGGEFTVPMTGSAIGQHRRLTIAAGDVSLALLPAQRSTVLNILPARITAVTRVGENQMVAVLGLGPEGEGSRILARVTRRSWDDLGLDEGMMVYAQAKSVALVRK